MSIGNAKQTIPTPTYSTDNIRKFPRFVKGSLEELQLAFDQGTIDSKNYLISLVNLFNSATAATYIGFSESGYTADNVKAGILEAITKCVAKVGNSTLNGTLEFNNAPNETGTVQNNQLKFLFDAVNLENGIQFETLLNGVVTDEGGITYTSNEETAHLRLSFGQTEIKITDGIVLIKQERPLYQSTLTYPLLATGWVASGDSFFPFKRDCAISPVTTTTNVTVDPTLASKPIAQACGLGHAELGTDLITFYAKSIPSGTITLNIDLINRI